jgi:glycosyltransferase involved in cell wall biosynthesis
MIDNNKKENLRQLCGALAFRVFHRKRIDAAWVPGASGHELMRFFGLPETGIYQGVYGADPGVFPPGPRLASRPKQFVFVGQLIPRKAPDLLVRAFERFRSRSPDWRLVMIGDGPLRCSLSGESIEVVPFLPPDIIAERLRQSRFLVLPSHEEHWGLIVHEAALSGCGLILSDMVGSGPDLLTDRNGFLFRSADEAALYRTLCDAANTPEHMLDQMYEESIKVARRFGPEHFVRSFRQIAESVTHK